MRSRFSQENTEKNTTDAAANRLRLASSMKKSKAETHTEARTARQQRHETLSASSTSVTVAQKQIRPKRQLTARTKKRIAAATVTLSALFALRWYDANRTPTIPLVTAPTILSDIPMNGPNAIHFYAAAADAISQKDMSLDAPDKMTQVEMQQAIARNSASLALLRQGFQYRYQGGLTHWMKTSAALNMDAPVPNYVAQRTLGRLLAADARVKAAKGDAAGAISTSIDLIRFGRDISHGDNALIGGMIGSLLDGMGSQEGLKTPLDMLNASQARAATLRLEAMSDGELSLPEMLNSDERFGLGTYQTMFGPSSRPLSLFSNTHVVSPYIPDGLAINSEILLHGKQGIVDNYTVYMNEVTRRASLPYQQAKSLPPISLTQYAMNQSFTPNTERARRALTQRVALDRLLLTRLALQTWQQEHPSVATSSLDVLAAGPNPALSHLPKDPFSLDGNAPFCFENGRVYSVGENGIDDHGTGDDDPANWK